MDTYKPIELVGANDPGARFGFSFCYSGDLNKDGYNDIIIGAPYTNAGQGAIFVYLGSNDGIRSTYSQVWIYHIYFFSLIIGFLEVKKKKVVKNNKTKFVNKLMTIHL